MRSILIAGIVFALLPIVLFKPHVGILLWTWLSYMNPHRLTFGFAYDLSSPSPRSPAASSPASSAAFPLPASSWSGCSSLRGCV